LSALTVTPAKPRFPAPKPTTIQELEPAERVLVWAVRSWTAAGWRQQAVWRDFAARFGSDALTVMTAFERLLRDLEQGARRPLVWGAPDVHGLQVDELCLLLLISALQGEETALAGSILGWLVTPAAKRGVLSAAEALARELEEAEMICPLRVSTPRIVGAPLSLVALH
jgi:hypothetical protein